MSLKCQKFENSWPARQTCTKPFFVHYLELRYKNIVRKTLLWNRKLKEKKNEKGSEIQNPARLISYHGSNSWMMLSNRITAKSRLAKPTSHAKERMVKVSKDCQPIVCVFASAELIFLSLEADASLSSTSILEPRPRFCG